MKYGFKCPCHGVQIFETQDQRATYLYSAEELGFTS